MQVETLAFPSADFHRAVGQRLQSRRHDELDSREHPPHGLQRLRNPLRSELPPVQQDDTVRVHERLSLLHLVEDAAPAGKVGDRAEDSLLILRHVLYRCHASFIAQAERIGAKVVVEVAPSGRAQASVHGVTNNPVKTFEPCEGVRVEGEAPVDFLQQLVFHRQPHVCEPPCEQFRAVVGTPGVGEYAQPVLFFQP